jgi:hypothetical protein
MIKLLDDKYRLRGLPIEEGEHLLYGDLIFQNKLQTNMLL